ncbi:Alpha-tocopherol transfer protein like [Argiope bruennichi]|uniref:Alpha-tocopherol transfer protein like n=1 Tax=Argiope bruennichi TaxID=94029 RepID=A0A8T0EQ67_ARGBR|nr:Alpha-tocopherol transfer protein like [Argiope bruennichi]
MLRRRSNGSSTITRKHDKLLAAFEGISMSVATARSPQHIWASPYRLENNSILIVGRGPTFDFNSITLIERFYLEVVVVNSFINNPLTQLYGITAIFDYTGFRYSSIFHYTPGIVRLLVNTLQNSLPLPIKACHVVNLPPILTSVANIVFGLLSKKIKSRITFHPSNDGYKSLHAVLNPELIPEEFGGNIKQSKMIDLSEKIEELELQLMDRFKFGYVKSQERREAFRLNPPINAHKAVEENEENVNVSSTNNGCK